MRLVLEEEKYSIVLANKKLNLVFVDLLSDYILQMSNNAEVTRLIENLQKGMNAKGRK